MSKRIDSTRFIYHWIKAEPFERMQENDYETAFEVLLKIIYDGAVKSGEPFKTGYKSCICFTESPEYFMHSDRSKYQPFGVKYLKDYVFSLGGRTVIYMPSKEKNLLHDELLWRYMLHDPISTSDERPFGVDFTWEREWRLPAEELSILDAYSIIVPDSNYIDRIIKITDRWLDENAHEEYIRSHGRHEDPDPGFQDYIDDIRSMLSTPDRLF